MKTIIRFFLTLLIFSAATTSCWTPPDYSPVPEIVFNSMDKFEVVEPFSQSKQDSVVITIDFKDGDGDLGESTDNRNNPNYGTWGNYELRTFRKVSGNQFEEVILAANSKIFFPVLKPDRKRGPIEGKLDYAVYFPYARNARMTTVKFQIRIRDRALNVSNAVESDTISVPLLL